MDSILDTIKQKLGIESSYTAFDVDIITSINTVLMALHQLNIGPVGGFSITDKDDVWVDLLGTVTNVEAVKDYIYLKVRVMFDPPSNAFLVESLNRTADELAWRIVTQREFMATAEGDV